MFSVLHECTGRMHEACCTRREAALVARAAEKTLFPMSDRYRNAARILTQNPREYAFFSPVEHRLGRSLGVCGVPTGRRERRSRQLVDQGLTRAVRHRGVAV